MTGRRVIAVDRVECVTVFVDAPDDVDQSVDDWIATWPEDAS